MKSMIMAAVMFLALIPTLLIGCAVNYYAQVTIKDEKLKALSDVVGIVDVHLSRYAERIYCASRMKAENDVFKRLLLSAGEESLFAEEERNVVKKTLLDDIGIRVISGAVISTDGQTVLSSQAEEEGLAMDKTELFRTVMSGSDSYLGIVTTDTVTDMIEIAVPIHDVNGRIIGILKQKANLELLNDYLNNLGLGESGCAFLIRKSGDMIYDKADEKPAMLYHEYQNNNSLEQLIADFKTGRLSEDSGIIEFDRKGVEYIGAYEKIDAIGCIAAIAVEKDEIFGDLDKVKLVLAVAAIFFLILIAACGYFTGYLHVKPVNMMNATLKKISNGDLTSRCSCSGASEYQELCRNINSLADSYQKSERELRLSSRVDGLTYLPNRNAIYELLDTLLYKHPNQALLLLELDGFRNVNDNLGYDIGDRIIMEVGDILRELPQHVCYPSRLGGAEFLIFITNWTAPKYPERIAEKIIKSIEDIRFIDEFHVDIGASIGIKYIEAEKLDKKKLIKNCNTAMHKAKLIARNTYFVHYPYLQKEL